MSKSFIGSALIGRNLYYNLYDKNRKNFDQQNSLFYFAQDRTMGASNFDILVANEIQNNEEIQKILLNFEDNLAKTKQQTKNNLISKTQQMALQSKNIYNKIQRQIEEIKNMGFDIKYDYYEDSDYYKETNYHIKSVFPSTQHQYGYATKFIDIPLSVNGFYTLSSDWDLENPFMRPVLNLESKYPTLKSDFTRAKTTFERLSKHKLSLLLNKEKKEEFKKAKNEYTNLKLTIEYMDKLQNKANVYTNLTQKQKETLKDFIQNIKTLKSISAQCLKNIVVIDTIDNNLRFHKQSDINEINDKLVQKSKKLFTKNESVALDEFEKNTAQKIISFSDKQKDEIIDNFNDLKNGFIINEKTIDNNILYSISNNCSNLAVKEYNLQKSQE